MKKLGILLVLVGILVYWQWSKREESVHYHAGFTVYVNGEKQDYSDWRYMHLELCTDGQEQHEDEQIEKAHLHDGVGDVVHVHRTGAKWGDLFENIGVKLAEEPAILQQAVEPNSSVIIMIGQSVANPEKVTIEHIQDVEAKSELCGSN